jgi:NitT/TauT family transport system ATP-binding protein
MSDSALSFTCEQVSYTFLDNLPTHALQTVNFSARVGEFVCIVGPSGCGKSTLLKLLAGLLEPTAGKIRFTPSTQSKYQTSMVFQNQGLFPWLTVLDNVTFGLDQDAHTRSNLQVLARQGLEKLGLIEFANAFPHQLSGGMRQRVAILRAFLANAPVLLMDEPFGALDAQTKLMMQTDLLQLWNQSKTVVYVTHDIEEAILLADRILVMSGRPGKISAEIAVHFSRPRDLDLRQSPTFAQIFQQVWQMIQSEVRLQVNGVFQ